MDLLSLSLLSTMKWFEGGKECDMRVILHFAFCSFNTKGWIEWFGRFLGSGYDMVGLNGWRDGMI